MLLLPSLYGSLAISRVVMQVVTATLERRKQAPEIDLPPAALIVPVYNEDIRIFARALVSFVRQDYPNLEIIVIDDGSKNHKAIERACRRAQVRYIYQENAGKRRAMYAGFAAMADDVRVVFTADSDTIWSRTAATELATLLLADKKTGAVTGEVAVLNYRENLLTRLVGLRYFIAFNQERASQSFFKTVTCVSGPLGAYRRDVIDQIKERFISQRLFGKLCTYGDDRHLTNLVLDSGYNVRYAAGARCLTQCPDTMKQLVKQQTRWAKSYWRESIWQLRVLPKHGLYLVYDWTISLVLPFLLLFSALHYGSLVLDGPKTMLTLLATLLGMGFLRIAEPMIRTRNWLFSVFLLYGFMYFAVFLPVKFYALATINDGKWGTR